MHTIKNNVTYTPRRTTANKAATTTTRTPLQQQFEDKQNKVKEK